MMKRHHITLWMAESGGIMLLLFAVFCVFNPLNHVQSQMEFFAGVFLTILLWISFLTFLITLLSWIASKIFH